MNRILLKTTALGVLLALAATACSDDASDRDGPVAAASAGGEAEPGGPTVKGAPPTTEGLTGIWFADQTPFGPMLGLFGSDGTFAFDQEGLLDSKPGFAGTYEIDGRVVTLSYTTGDWTCIVLEAGLSEDGLLHTVFIDHPDRPPECAAGPYAGTEITYSRVSPSSSPGAEITAEVASDEGAFPSSESEVFGIWLLQGTGQLLRLSRDGNYALDDGGRLATNPDDRGTFEVGGKGTLTLTSGAKSTACPPGAAWAWKGVRLSAGVLLGVVSEDACRRDLGAEVTWIRLSP